MPFFLHPAPRFPDRDLTRLHQQRTAQPLSRTDQLARLSARAARRDRADQEVNSIFPRQGPGLGMETGGRGSTPRPLLRTIEDLMTEPLRIALAGLGTVGRGVIRLLDANGELIARRAGRPIEVVAVSARDRSKDRGVDIKCASTGSTIPPNWRGILERRCSGRTGRRRRRPRADARTRHARRRQERWSPPTKAMIAHHGLELARRRRASAGRRAQVRSCGRPAASW